MKKEKITIAITKRDQMKYEKEIKELADEIVLLEDKQIGGAIIYSGREIIDNTIATNLKERIDGSKTYYEY